MLRFLGRRHLAPSRGASARPFPERRAPSARERAQSRRDLERTNASVAVFDAAQPNTFSASRSSGGCRGAGNNRTTSSL